MFPEVVQHIHLNYNYSIHLEFLDPEFFVKYEISKLPQLMGAIPIVREII